ncbi:unnamed protein product [Linum tenue]|uniref:Cell division control protein 73 C-terminal domain-containing protein n=1 Tax=Linum tenue TaxID=586396 RepID=A0AAV0P4M0_9ROSI|nr:unnamed protein product [Linum tenue]
MKPNLRGKNWGRSAFQTLITIYNVKEFLEDGVYIPPDVKVKQMKGAKPACVTVQKKFSTDRSKVMTAYEVRDKPSALKSDDWDRVVAVLVLRKEWQFKDWPYKDQCILTRAFFSSYPLGQLLSPSVMFGSLTAWKLQAHKDWLDISEML